MTSAYATSGSGATGGEGASADSPEEGPGVALGGSLAGALGLASATSSRVPRTLRASTTATTASRSAAATTVTVVAVGWAAKACRMRVTVCSLLSGVRWGAIGPQTRARRIVSQGKRGWLGPGWELLDGPRVAVGIGEAGEAAPGQVLHL